MVDPAEYQRRYRRKMRRLGFREIHEWVPGDLYDELTKSVRDIREAELEKRDPNYCFTVTLTGDVSARRMAQLLEVLTGDGSAPEEREKARIELKRIRDRHGRNGWFGIVHR